MEFKCTLNDSDLLKVSKMGNDSLLFEIALKGAEDDGNNIILLDGKDIEKLVEFINGVNL